MELTFGTILIVFVVIAILVAVIFTVIESAFGKKQFDDQVSGRRPEKEFKNNGRRMPEAEPSSNIQIEIDKEISNMRNFQNLVGPK